jgi:hypothetical protein
LPDFAFAPTSASRVLCRETMPLGRAFRQPDFERLPALSVVFHHRLPF